MWVKSSNPLGSKVRASKQTKTVHRHALPRLAKRIRIAEPVTLHQQKTSHENGKWILNQDCNCCSKDPKMDLWVKPFRHIYPEPPWRGCRNRSGMVTVTWKPNPLTQKKDQTFSHVSKLQNANIIYTKYFVGIEIMICINIYIWEYSIDMLIRYWHINSASSLPGKTIVGSKAASWKPETPKGWRKKTNQRPIWIGIIGMWELGYNPENHIGIIWDITYH